MGVTPFAFRGYSQESIYTGEVAGLCSLGGNGFYPVSVQDLT